MMMISENYDHDDDDGDGDDGYDDDDGNGGDERDVDLLPLFNDLAEHFLLFNQVALQLQQGLMMVMMILMMVVTDSGGVSVMIMPAISEPGGDHGEV